MMPKIEEKMKIIKNKNEKKDYVKLEEKERK